MKNMVPATTRHQILLAWSTLTKKSDPTPGASVSCVDMHSIRSFESLTAQKSPSKAAHRQNGYVQVLELEEAIVADRVIVVLPQSVDGVSNVANVLLEY